MGDNVVSRVTIYSAQLRIRGYRVILSSSDGIVSDLSRL